MEKISSLAKDTRIKSLEDLVVKIGYDPSNMKDAEEIIKKKNVDITTLRKQLKLSATKYPLTKDIEDTETQNIDMMKLIIEKNAHIRQMETKMEKMIKEKEQAAKLSMVPLDVVPLTTIHTNTASTTPTTYGVDKLKKVVENLSIKT